MADYKEYQDSQKPAMQLLQKMNWQYLKPEEAFLARGEQYTNVILDTVLAEQLHKINSFSYRNKVHHFSNSNIQSAINTLKNVPNLGLVQTNEKIYDLLSLGKSFNETIQGDRKAYTLNYIDWQKPENNSYHFTEEYIVESPNGKRRPDIVLFVNGIPFVVIENKRRDNNDSVKEAISQHIGNQKEKEGIPKLFHYAQLLLAVQPNQVKYGATGTPANFWSVWKEDVATNVQKLLNSNTNNTLATDRLATAQDKSIYALCEPKRLLDLVYKYIVFDGPNKKIARYQQYFAVQETLKRVQENSQGASRQGGVIWHTTGSGKSLTMVMLSKALALETAIESPRVIVVTDRISLDKQIFKTFNNCGKNVKKAKSGTHLVSLLQDKGNEIITTIIDKFQTAANADYIDRSKNIFVLVDESHRSQYGTANINMRKILPNASYIGFTGTPLMKAEKNTSKKFGGFIHKYTIDQAVKDQAVLPLLYEGRAAKLSVNQKQIDKGFERLASDLSKDAQKDLKKKFASIMRIYESDHVIEEIAYDISQHYTKNWQGKGFKAQLAVPKIDTAIKYQKYFEQQTDSALKINTKVVFTPPDKRSDNDDVWSNSSNESRNYWDSIMAKHRNQEVYEKWVIDHFKEASQEVEIIIVVSKLLTGFDAPRNTILYLAKPLKGHNLLQAIARVNRLFEGKEYGYIIDYIGILGKLDEALTAYSALEDFDEEDLVNAVKDIKEEIRKIPLRHADILDIFKDVKNKKDTEALEQHLKAKDLRDEFYSRVSVFARLLQTAFSSDDFYKEYTAQEIAYYKKELKFFVALRKSVQFRYAEVVSYGEYEPRVRKLLDSYVDVDEINILASGVNIFDKNMVEEALETYGKTAASKADFIAHNLKKTITENLEKDEAYYKKFSELINEIINAFQEGRIEETEYLSSITKIREDFANGYQENIPKILHHKPEARAFFGAISNVLIQDTTFNYDKKTQDILATIGIDIAAIVSNLTIRDWKKNIDVQRKMENDIEDYLISHRKDLDLDLSFDAIDLILEKCLKIAKNNY